MIHEHVDLLFFINLFIFYFRSFILHTRIHFKFIYRIWNSTRKNWLASKKATPREASFLASNRTAAYRCPSAENLRENKFCFQYLTVHLFGAKSSPACVNFALKRLANEYEGKFGKGASDFLRRHLYVDDSLRSVASAGTAVKLFKDTQALCQKGGFKVHKVLSNCKEA